MRRVVFVAVPPIQILDLTGPFEAFSRCGGYKVELFTSDPSGEILASNGLRIVDARHYDRLRGPLDTLLLPGGEGAEELRVDAAFLRWLKRTGARARRV